MATLAERLRAGLKSAFGGGRAAQLKALEERASRPSEQERVVVDPKRKLKKKPNAPK